MNKTLTLVMSVIMIMTFIAIECCTNDTKTPIKEDTVAEQEVTTKEEPTTEYVKEEPKIIYLDDKVETRVYELEEESTTEEEIVTPEFTDDILLLSKVVYAEAGNQDETGKRLVVDTILNRVDSSDFPNTIYDVIYQSGQFDCASYLDTITPDLDIAYLVIDEMENRKDTDVLYFRTNYYHNFGTPLYQHGAHYFSK